MVPGAGLEPARLAAQASKTCVAANYTTPARTTVADNCCLFLSIGIRFRLLWARIQARTILSWSITVLVKQGRLNDQARNV